MIVVDTNIVAYLLLPGDETKVCERVFSKDPSWAAPLLWRSELRSVLAQYMRKHSLSLEDATTAMETAEQLFLDREYAVPSAEVLALCQRSHLSAYDAEFVVLAQSLAVPLVTQDRQILRAAEKIAVSPTTFCRA